MNKFSLGAVPTAAAMSQTLPNATADPTLNHNAPRINYKDVTIVIDVAHVEALGPPSDWAGLYAKGFGREAIYATAIGGGRSWVGLMKLVDAFELQPGGYWRDTIAAEARYHKELTEVASVMQFSIPH